MCHQLVLLREKEFLHSTTRPLCNGIFHLLLCRPTPDPNGRALPKAAMFELDHFDHRANWLDLSSQQPYVDPAPPSLPPFSDINSPAPRRSSESPKTMPPMGNLRQHRQPPSDRSVDVLTE
jgi:hypothetical protein